MNRTPLALSLTVVLALAGCTEPAAPTCTPEVGGPPVDAPTVCGHLDALGCRHDDDPLLTAVEECTAHYATFQGKVASGDFARLTQCYAAATDCAAVAGCSVACTASPDAGP